MAEYIDREAARETFCNRCGSQNGFCDKDDCFMMKDIDRIPAADVAPVRHGRWNEKMFRGLPLFECSACGISNPWGKTFYCPTCGAKMDEVSE